MAYWQTLRHCSVFDSRIPALAVNDLIDGLMYALIDAVTAGERDDRVRLVYRADGLDPNHPAVVAA